MRNVQQMRKEANLTLEDKTRIEAPSWPVRFEKEILAGTASLEIVKGSELKVTAITAGHSNRHRRGEL